MNRHEDELEKEIADKYIENMDAPDPVSYTHLLALEGKPEDMVITAHICR